MSNENLLKCPMPRATHWGGGAKEWKVLQSSATQHRDNDASFPPFLACASSWLQATACTCALACPVPRWPAPQEAPPQRSGHLTLSLLSLRRWAAQKLWDGSQAHVRGRCCKRVSPCCNQCKSHVSFSLRFERKNKQTQLICSRVFCFWGWVGGWKQGGGSGPPAFSPPPALQR